MKPQNKTVASVALALQFVAEHKEMFEVWVKMKKAVGEIGEESND